MGNLKITFEVVGQVIFFFKVVQLFWERGWTSKALSWIHHWSLQCTNLSENPFQLYPTTFSGVSVASKCESKSYYRLENNFNYNLSVFTVGSFVWTHLQNLKKTSVPYHLELQTMLSGDINKKFNTDIRKFSRNYEYSFFLTEYGVGEYTPTYVETDVIHNFF